jgi:hypothetical protein
MNEQPVQAPAEEAVPVRIEIRRLEKLETTRPCGEPST